MNHTFRRYNYFAAALCTFFVANMAGQSLYPVHPALRAEAFIANNQTDSALLVLSQLIDSKQNTEKWLLQRGNLLLKTNRVNEAIDDFRRIEKTRPGMASYALALAYARLYDTSNTLYFLEKNLNSTFRVSKNIIESEKAFNFIRNTPPWKKLWEKEWYSRYDYFEGEMRYLFDAADWTGVINMMADAGNDTRRLSATCFYMTAIAYRQLQNYAAAINYLAKAIDKSKKEAKYHAALGECYLQMKNFSRALDSYNRAIEVNPGDVSLYCGRSRALLGLKKYDQAYENAIPLAQLFPNNREVIEVLVLSAFQSNHYLTALTYINPLLGQSPRDTAFLYLRAKCYARTGMPKQALNDYDTLIKYYPQHPLYLLERGNIYYQLNDKSKACTDWYRAAQLGNIQADRLHWENCSK
jgi:tetratricopeptide (TPR) repeat protein